MDENEVWEPELVWEPGRVAGAEAVIGELAARGWRGRVSDLEPVAVQALWWDALVYARWEIKQYARWREQDEPVLADGYDAEGVVQAAFARLLERETWQSAKTERGGGVSIFYGVEELRREVRSLVKHRVRWLHERKETGLVVGEWDVLPARPDGELVSIFDYMPGRIAKPDSELMQKEKEKLLGEFKVGFEKSLGKREQLKHVFRRVWDGEKRRHIAQRLGMGVERVKILQRRVNERLATFAAEAQGGVAEMLGSFKKC